VKEAKYYTRLETGEVKCSLCPHQCIIKPGKRGRCGIRYNNEEILVAEGYGLLSSLALDPIEKKPLYHFYPGRSVLSAGGFGCNLRCNFCQNFEISQIGTERYHGNRYTPEFITEKALEIPGNLGVAFTYNEPVISIETVLATSELLKKADRKVIMVSNGFINKEPLKDILPLTDAWNIDLKGFSDTFYNRECGGSLRPVLQTIEVVRNSGNHLELTCLIIPGKNDSVSEMKDMVRWISENTGKDTVFHLSRYFPRYKSTIPPTPTETLKLLYQTAKEVLCNVYAGNIHEDWGRDSVCPECGYVYITRDLYSVKLKKINDNHCPQCGAQLYGKF